MKLVDKIKSKFKKSPEEIEERLNDPNLLRIKNPKLQKGVEFAVKVINSRAVRRTTHTAKEVLNITEKVKEGNVISVTAAGLASLETVAGFLNVEKPDPYEIFMKHNSLTETSEGKIVELISSPNVYDKIDRRVALKEKEFSIVRFELGEDNFIYAKSTQNKNNPEKQGFYWKYLVPEDFCINKAYDHIWSFFGGKAYVVREDNKMFSWRGGGIQLKPLVLNDEDLLLDEKEMDRVGTEIEKSRDKGKSRSYLLVGPPGTGKSSFCYKAAERFCPRILKVDPSVMERMTVGELEEFISGIKPDALIFDDIDRCFDQEHYLLFLLENLKRNFPEMVIFASANDFDDISEAIRRPGRFDRVLWVTNPDEKTRREFFEYFAPKHGLKINSKLMENIIEGTEGLSQAYLAEMIYRATNDADIDLSFKGSIREFRTTLELDGLLEEVVPSRRRAKRRRRGYIPAAEPMEYGEISDDEEKEAEPQLMGDSDSGPGYISGEMTTASSNPVHFAPPSIEEQIDLMKKLQDSQGGADPHLNEAIRIKEEELEKQKQSEQ